MADIAHTLQVGREAFNERFAAMMKSRRELFEILSRYTDTGTPPENGWEGSVHRATDDAVPKEAPREVYEQGDLRAAARLWVHGASVDWARLPHHANRRRTPLPTYPFEKRRCWLTEPGPDQRPPVRSRGDAPAPDNGKTDHGPAHGDIA